MRPLILVTNVTVAQAQITASLRPSVETIYKGMHASGVGKRLGTVVLAMFRVLSYIWIFCFFALAQQPTSTWQDEVRKCALAQDWTTAISIVDREIARAPQDMDTRSWRARVLFWSGKVAEAEREYDEILTAVPNDPDNWMALANVYSRQSRTQDALQALNHAVELDPKRSDLHAALGRALRAADNRSEAKLEFRRARELDPTSKEAELGLLSLRGEPRHEMRVGVNSDLFSFSGANDLQGVSFMSHWTPSWKTSVSENFYQRAGTDAETFVASVTGKLPRMGALTVGGAAAHDNSVIPKNEVFFDYDQGWRLAGTKLLHGFEIVYGQHWYWYTTARILTINEMTLFYLPRDWTWSVGLTGARSHFPGTGAEWRPSGLTRIGFPISAWHERRLQGNVFFAIGTENFAQVDQIGQFSSQTYGGGLRLQLTQRHDVTGFAAYQKRTQDRTQTSFGFTYGFRF
jgi:cytochrome c-type biogenesis protein CcmH/NrfG